MGEGDFFPHIFIIIPVCHERQKMRRYFFFPACEGNLRGIILNQSGSTLCSLTRECLVAHKEREADSQSFRAQFIFRTEKRSVRDAAANSSPAVRF